MGKLLFETDEGDVKEVTFSAVKTKNLTTEDIIIASYEVGDISDAQKNLAGKALLDLKTLLERQFPEGQKILVTAMRHGKEDVSIKIVKDKTKE